MPMARERRRLDDDLLDVISIVFTAPCGSKRSEVIQNPGALNVPVWINDPEVEVVDETRGPVRGIGILVWDGSFGVWIDGSDGDRFFD